MRYFFALVVHSADHFFIDQLAAIVQGSKKLGTQSIFVSIVDYASSDSTPFLSDLAEAVMLILGIPFRIRRVPPMTEDPAASYYPLEEAYTRNLALEPLFELYDRRKVTFSRVIWLKGFTCPNDLLETLRISLMNQATMVCSMDWKEHNGFFIYNDRYVNQSSDLSTSHVELVDLLSLSDSLNLFGPLGQSSPFSIAGEHVIWMEICSEVRNLHHLWPRHHLVIPPVLLAIINIYRSRSSVANQARILSILQRPITRESSTVPQWLVSSISLPLVLESHRFGPKAHVWTRARCTFVVTFG